MIGAMTHQRALARWPHLKERMGSPMNEVFMWIAYGAVPAVVIGALVFVFLLIIAPSRVHRDLIDEIERLRKALSEQDRSLRILFDEDRHRTLEGNKMCAMFRISVVNESRRTVRNVAVRIVSISGRTRRLTRELSGVVGLPLCVAADPSGGAAMPTEMPQRSAVIHPGESALFDMVRLCKTPGNHWICHANYMRRAHAVFYAKEGVSPFEQRPHAVLPPGKYRLVVAVSGDDISPSEASFEFWATKRSLILRKID